MKGVSVNDFVPGTAAARPVQCRSGRRGLTPILPDAYISPATGRMAEWLCNGLQIRVQRFDSASGLQRADAAPLVWVPALIPGSSVVEQAAVNRWVDGSNPSRGANHDGGQERYS